ncbi:MAG: glycosyltransferase family 39 protein [Acetatifactor sp.]|nr:glycosyltransferase family 39 protein [Acetatifactor sp.]
MKLNKNILSYIIWAVYAGIVLYMCMVIGNALSGRLGINPYGGIGILAGAILVCGIISLVINKIYIKNPISDKKWFEHNRFAANLLKFIPVTAILIAGVYLRVVLIDFSYDPQDYFEAAKLNVSASMYDLVHPARYFYLSILHFVFRFLGNRMDIGIFVQIVLFVISSLLIYNSVKETSGIFAGLVVFSALMFTPTFTDFTLTYTVNSLIFLFFAFTLKVCTDALHNPDVTLSVLWAGFDLGVLLYLDSSSFILTPLIIIGIILVQIYNYEGFFLRAKSIFWMVLGFVLGFVLVMFINGFINRITFPVMWDEWMNFYRNNLKFDANKLAPNSFNLVEIIILLLCLGTGLFNYWFGYKIERKSIYVAACVGYIVTTGFDLYYYENSKGIYICFIVFVLAAMGLSDTFYGKKKPIFAGEGMPDDLLEEKYEPDEETVKEEGDKNLDEELKAVMITPLPTKDREDNETTDDREFVDVSSHRRRRPVPTAEVDLLNGANTSESSKEVTETKPVSDTDCDEPKQASKKTEFIKNPLPGPRPHVKKDMDFDKKLDIDTSDYDIDISDDDDFDI